MAPDEQDIFATATTYDEDAAAFSDPEAGAGSDDDYYDYPSYGFTRLHPQGSEPTMSRFPTMDSVP